LFDRIFGQPSARVVALARLGLAAIFFLGTWAEPQQGAAPIVMPMLVGFLIFSAGIALVTWRNWWVDARIALVTHAIDICYFVIIVGSPQGYTSPYFLFFVFLLLSSAIRWTWRETAATAAVVVVLYIFAGLLMGMTSHTPFETRRFIIRSGYLLIMSAVLIWFGVRRRFSAGALLGGSALTEAQSGDPPLVAALRRAMQAAGASHGTATWTHPDGREETLATEGEEVGRGTMPPVPKSRELTHAFLFDAKRDRALLHADSGTPQFTSVSVLTGDAVLEALADHQGIGIPIDGRLGRGLILLWGVKDLHSDHLALGERLHSEVPSLMERRLLFSALREGAIARERVALARNLHDGVVQFLAGSAYKIEAISRSSESSDAVAADLQELKQLMLLEQEDLRSSIGTLRKDKVGLEETAAEAKALCKRLARQWRVKCSCASDVRDARVPARLHMDLLNMIKEGVANAARHGAASKVEIRFLGNERQLELIVKNDAGAGASKASIAPWSIRERTAEIGGSVSIAMEGRSTVLRIAVPVPEDGE
jgi:signal transduction histidine kinase